MRKGKHSKAPTDVPPESAARAVAYDEKAFFESFYRTNVKGSPTDCMTIGGVAEPESRFHYNATENSIIRALLSISPLPDAGMLDAWTLLRRRRGDRMLDIGSGTGHWIDFMRDVFWVRFATGLELTSQMSDYLREKYRGDKDVVILQDDIASEDYDTSLGNGPFDYVTAIGVMFHIVDDTKWEIAVRNIVRSMKDDALLIVGDDFSIETRNVQFHKTDRFSNWREFKNGDDSTELKVNKRVRSLSDWQGVAARHGLSLVTLLRTDRDAAITTPENDILVLRKNRTASKEAGAIGSAG